MSGAEEASNNVPSTSTNIIERTDENINDAVDSKAGILAVASEASSSSSEEYIRVRVITSDLTNEVQFRIKGSTLMKRLKNSYCTKLGFPLDEFRFIFDGHRIADTDTATTLGMVDEDVIEVYPERTGGM